MKIKEIKSKLKNEQYNIPDVLSKIKNNMPAIEPYVPQKRKLPKFRLAIGFVVLIFISLFTFTVVASPQAYAQASGPERLSYFSSYLDIEKTIDRNDKEQSKFQNQAQGVYDSYKLDDIRITKVYEPNNNQTVLHNNYIYHLNDKGLVIYDILNNDPSLIKYRDLQFDNSTYLKTIHIIGDALVIIYNNNKGVHVRYFDISLSDKPENNMTMNLLYSYSIISTYIDSYVYNNKLYLVTILNDIVLPSIKVNNTKKLINSTDVGYLNNIIGNSYTILTTIDFDYDGEFFFGEWESIFLSFNKWDYLYFDNNNLYLVNNHLNYKKTLEYGEYTTVLKFENTKTKGFTYQGSYTIKGSVSDKNSIYADGDNLRLALNVIDYNIKYRFFIFREMIAFEHYINVVNLNFSKENNNAIVKLTSNYKVSPNSDIDANISVRVAKFTKDKLTLQARSTTNQVIILHFSDPNNIIFEAVLVNMSLSKNNIVLNNTYEFNLKPIQLSAGIFEFRFFSLSKGNNVSDIYSNIVTYALSLNYSFLLDEADYVVVDAINNSNQFYLNEDSTYIYIGFYIKTNTNSNSAYTLIRFNKLNNSIEEFNLSSKGQVIKSLINIERNIFYAVTDNSLIQYNLSEDKENVDFVQTKNSIDLN